MMRSGLNLMSMLKRPGSSEEAMDDLAGRYDVRRVLQKAIFGSVLLVSPVDRPAERVVLKAVSKGLMSSRRTADGLPVTEDHGVELRVLSAARANPHPNVLGLCPDEFQVDARRTTYTALPYLAGGELFGVVEAGGAVPDDAARRLGYALARGLDHLHRELGFVHNDVSLENVLLSAKGEPVVCDFGLATELGSAWDPRRRIGGKLPYQAPEIYAGTARTSDPRSDVFSLGVTLFVLLTGIPPFDLPDPCQDQRYHYVDTGRMGELLKLWGKPLAPEAVDLLTRMLYHDPSRRIGMAEVLAHPWFAPAAAAAARSAEAEAERAAARAMREEEEEEEEELVLQDDELVFGMDMDMDMDTEEQEAKCSSAPVATPTRRARDAGKRPPLNNHTASPDSVFSFEQAYRKHAAARTGADYN